jgi:hypothetical protein
MSRVSDTEKKCSFLKDINFIIAGFMDTYFEFEVFQNV